MPRRRRAMFIPVPPVRNTKWDCTINGISIHDFILSASFPWGLITEELVCEIELDNSGEDFTDKFKEDDEIIFNMDFSDGTTVQFKGDVEEIQKKISTGYILNIKGTHFTARLTDITITEEFTDATISDIQTSLIANLSGFTSTNVVTNNTIISIKFVNKPLLDCLIQVGLLGDQDTYIDHDKDLNTFKKNSRTNLVAHITETDSLLELTGLGTDSAEKRNKIVVYGDAGGLPVIATSDDQATRTKEKIVTDNTITTETQASEFASTELDRLKNPDEFGSASTLFMLTLTPGDRIYVISTPHKLHALFRVVKFIFKVPEETMEIYFNQERTLPKLFKDRIIKDEGQETIVNPFKMLHSFNFGTETSFDSNKIDGSSSSNVSVVDGNLILDAGNESGDMISIEKATPIEVTSVHLIVTGETLDGVTYFISADGTNPTQEINRDVEIPVKVTGSKLKLRIRLTNTSTKIPNAVVLYK